MSAEPEHVLGRRATALARRIQACQALIDGTPEPGERAAAQAALARLEEKLRSEFGIDDATAVIDPIGEASVEVGAMRPWRLDAATAASILAGVAMTTWGTVRWKRVTFYGPRSARLLAEHMAHHLVSAIERETRAWRARRRADRKKTSRQTIAAFRRRAAEVVLFRCVEEANRHNPGWQEVCARLMPDDVEELPEPKPVDRRLAGARAGADAGRRIPLSRPVTGSPGRAPDALELMPR